MCVHRRRLRGAARARAPNNCPHAFITFYHRLRPSILVYHPIFLTSLRQCVCVFIRVYECVHVCVYVCAYVLMYVFAY